VGASSPGRKVAEMVTVFKFGSGEGEPSTTDEYTEAEFRTLCQMNGVGDHWSKSLEMLKDELYSHPYFFLHGGFIKIER
jgi:hypothetical protein